MAVNPMKLLKLKDEAKKFAQRHPKVVAFAKSQFLSDLPEGTVIEITVTKPDKKPVTANVRLKAEDAEMAKTIKAAF